jgi:hypothetical protein
MAGGGTATRHHCLGFPALAAMTRLLFTLATNWLVAACKVSETGRNLVKSCRQPSCVDWLELEIVSTAATGGGKPRADRGDVERRHASPARLRQTDSKTRSPHRGGRTSARAVRTILMSWETATRTLWAWLQTDHALEKPKSGIRP